MRTPIAPKSMLNTITTEALDRMFGSAAGSARKTPLAAGAPKAYANKVDSDIPAEKANEILMVADSGANRHFIPESRHTDYMFRVEEAKQQIRGMCSDNQSSTTHFGLFAASAVASTGEEIPFTSVAFAVKDGRKPLFSEVQCCFAGNTVLHKGHPKTGTHGIYLKDSKYFIPYEWSDKDHCWYIRLRAPGPIHCMTARTQDPRAMLHD